jgi:hypothetical protein
MQDGRLFYILVHHCDFVNEDSQVTKERLHYGERKSTENQERVGQKKTMKNRGKREKQESVPSPW